MTVAPSQNPDAHIRPGDRTGAVRLQAAVWIMAIGICFCIYSLVWLGRSYSVMASAR